MATKHTTIVAALAVAGLEPTLVKTRGAKKYKVTATAPESGEPLTLTWYCRYDGVAVGSDIHNSKLKRVGVPGVETRGGKKVRTNNLFAPQAGQVARHFVRLVTRKVFLINGDAAIVLWRDDKTAKLAPKITVYGKYGDNGTIRYVKDKKTIARFWGGVHGGTVPADVLWDWIEEHNLATTRETQVA